MSKLPLGSVTALLLLFVTVPQLHAQDQQDRIYYKQDLWKLISPSDDLQNSSPAMKFEIIVDGKALQPAKRDGDLWLNTGDLVGKEFQLRITNHDSSRVLFVIGIDGLSVIGKQPFREIGRGYVLDPGQTATIRGWRTNSDSVEAFEFTTPENSAAQGTEVEIRIGQIEVIAIAEQGQVEQHYSPSVFAPVIFADSRKNGDANRRSTSGSLTTSFTRGTRRRQIRFEYGSTLSDATPSPQSTVRLSHER